MRWWDPTICLVSPIPSSLPQTPLVTRSVLPYSQMSTNCILILGCPLLKTIPPLAWLPNFICLASTFSCSTNCCTIQCQRPQAHHVQGRQEAEKSNLYLAYNYPKLKCFRTSDNLIILLKLPSPHCMVYLILSFDDSNPILIILLTILNLP